MNGIETLPDHIVCMFITFLIRMHNTYSAKEILHSAQMRRYVMREHKRPIVVEEHQDEKLAQGAFGFGPYRIWMIRAQKRVRQTMDRRV